MLNNKHVIWVLFTSVILICGFVIVYFIQQNNPLYVIKAKMGIKLPSSAKIKNYEYDKKAGDIGAKILIADKDIEYTKKMLDNFFEGELPDGLFKNIPQLSNVYEWWDLDKNNIQFKYMSWVDEKKLFTRHDREVWAFISKDSKGQYYLYISY